MDHLLSLLNECVVGVLSTCDEEIIHSVPVYYHYNQAENAFYFISRSKSVKVDNLKKNQKASFSVYSERLPRTYSAQCSAQIFDVENTGFAGNQIIKKLAEVHSTQEYYPSPISAMKEGELKLIKLEVIDYQYKSYVANTEQAQRSA
jgi:nitroimidazol reductase NimA-like FMN-containing flavoprotein (pyridoxamine 5'-phosphate oxidase superfamily)